MRSKTFNLWLSWCGSCSQWVVSQSPRSKSPEVCLLLVLFGNLWLCHIRSHPLGYSMLLYCLILSRVEANCFWQQNTNIFLQHKSGGLFFSLRVMSTLVSSSSSYYGYLPGLLVGDLFDLKIAAWVILSRFHFNHTCKTTLCFMATYRKPTRNISAVFTQNEFWK